MKTEFKLVCAVVGGLFLAEVGSRAFEPRLSADVRQILSFETIPQEIVDARAKGRTIVLVLGNSLARAGVDEATLEAGLRENGWPSPKISYLTPDGTGVNEWTAAYRKIFPASKGIHPDLLILVTGPEHLLDHPVRSPEKLAAYHASRKDRRDIFCNWLTGESERCRFLLASVSRLFAIRERVRPLLFYNLVPGYEVTAQQLNRTGMEGHLKLSATVETTIRFQTLLDSLGLSVEKVFLVASPLPQSYRLPRVVMETASDRDVSVFQGAAGVSWPPQAFPDGYHLGEEFAEEFTRELVGQIVLSTRPESEL